MEDTICIFSYNSRGFDSSKQDVIKAFTTMSGCLTIICNQENFLLKNNKYMIKQILPEHHIVFKPATKDGFEGRPKNGMFIAIPIHFKDKFEDVSPKSNRHQTIVIENNSNKTLIINTYFPTDPKKDDYEDTELLLLLSDIAGIIDNNKCDQVVWTGDINADFRRNTSFVRVIEEFVSNLGMGKSWEKFAADFTHMTEREGVTHTSIIDHFFWNHEHEKNVIDAGVIHIPENMSDHCPIFCRFKMTKSSAQKQETAHEVIMRPSWKYASEKQKADYRDDVKTSLERICIPQHLLNCRNVHCKQINHKDDTDRLMYDVINGMESAAERNITPAKKQHTKKAKIPNWKTDAEPLKENAHFWHAIWESAGRPINCQLHNIMKKTRNRYHLLIRKKKRLLERVKREDMLASCLANDSSIFDAIRNKRKCKQSVPSIMDGRSTNIPGYLASKYEKLYNAVDDSRNLADLENHMEDNIQQKSIRYVNMINSRVMKQSAQKLKPGKTDPVLMITSDFLVHAPEIVFQLLSLCLKSYLIHAHVSDFLLISMFIPIIKDKLGDITSSNNYRSIAISSLIMKLFDLLIMNVFKEYLLFDDLQFGYQPEVSTSMCTWLVTETISHFLRNGSEVFTCLMDMSKAFDTVQHSILFKKLLDQGMPIVIVRFLFVTYRNQQANVKWNNEFSQYFNIKNGVKQGAVLSAVLYCVYTNGLFEALRRLKIGCYMGNDYVGVIGYADDLFLMSPSIFWSSRNAVGV